MSRKNALGPLVDLLVDLYPTEEGSRRVVAESGMHHGRIPFQDAAVDNWFAILSEADRLDAVGAVVAVAMEEYAEASEPLQAALDDYGSAPEDPETSDSENSFDLPTGPYRLNLAMVMIVALVLPMWFYLHIYPLVERSLAVGALGAGLAAGLLAAWKLTTTFLGKSWGQKGRSRVDRLLRNPKICWVLGSMVLLVLGLAGSTSSVYLVHDDKVHDGQVHDGKNLKELVISIQERSKANADELKPFKPMPRLKTTPSVALAGGPIFFRRPGKTLVFGVESSPILQVESDHRRLWPWKRIELRASVDFKARAIQVFRLAPGNQVMGRLPEPGNAVPFKSYALEVLWDGEPVGRLDDLRQGVVYFGDEPELIETLRQGESAEQKRRQLGKCVDAAFVDELMEYWDSGFQVAAAARPPGAEQLEIRILEMTPSKQTEDLNPQAGVLRLRVVVPAEDISNHGLHTICLQGAFQ